MEVTKLKGIQNVREIMMKTQSTDGQILFPCPLCSLHHCKVSANFCHSEIQLHLTPICCTGVTLPQGTEKQLCRLESFFAWEETSMVQILPGTTTSEKVLIVLSDWVGLQGPLSSWLQFRFINGSCREKSRVFLSKIDPSNVLEETEYRQVHVFIKNKSPIVSNNPGDQLSRAELQLPQNKSASVQDLKQKLR